MDMERPLAIDAFCGAGGLSLGLIRAGFNMCFAFDNDEKAVKTYSNNLQNHVQLINAYDLDLKSELRKKNIRQKDIVLFAGGPPCQGFSLQRRGDFNDPRNDLVRVFFELAFSIKPNFILMENVMGIKGERGKSLLKYVNKKCDANNYFCHVKEINSADFGAPQIRRRFFIIAERKDGTKTKLKMPKPKFSSKQFRTVKNAIGDLPSPPSDGSEHSLIPNHRCDVLSKLNKKRFQYVPQAGGREDIPPKLRLACHKVSVKKAGHRYVYGRLAWNKPSGVITARFDSLTRGRFGHPSETRTISLREGARLQTFSDNFIFYGNKVEIARQIGNAIPPVVSEVLGRVFLSALKSEMKIKLKSLS